VQIRTGQVAMSKEKRCNKGKITYVPKGGDFHSLKPRVRSTKIDRQRITTRASAWGKQERSTERSMGTESAMRGGENSTLGKTQGCTHKNWFQQEGRKTHRKKKNQKPLRRYG